MTRLQIVEWFSMNKQEKATGTVSWLKCLCCCRKRKLPFFFFFVWRNRTYLPKKNVWKWLNFFSVFVFLFYLSSNTIHCFLSEERKKKIVWSKDNILIQTAISDWLMRKNTKPTELIDFANVSKESEKITFKLRASCWKNFPTIENDSRFLLTHSLSFLFQLYIQVYRSKSMII